MWRLGLSDPGQTDGPTGPQLEPDFHLHNASELIEQLPGGQARRRCLELLLQTHPQAVSQERHSDDFRELPADAAVNLEHPSEIALAKKILQFADALEVVGRELKPNVLTDYLYDLAKAFSRFYDKKLGVRVIDASPESVRISRLRLCDITARVLRLGLRLLGIDTIEQM